MSSMLEQAIIDAGALKEAAKKSAEEKIVEHFSNDIKEAVDKILEQDEFGMDLGMPSMVGAPVSPYMAQPYMPPTMAPETGLIDIEAEGEDAHEGEAIVKQSPYAATTSNRDIVSIDLDKLEESIMNDVHENAYAHMYNEPVSEDLDEEMDVDLPELFSYSADLDESYEDEDLVYEDESYEDEGDTQYESMEEIKNLVMEALSELDVGAGDIDGGGSSGVEETEASATDVADLMRSMLSEDDELEEGSFFADSAKEEAAEAAETAAEGGGQVYSGESTELKEEDIFENIFFEEDKTPLAKKHSCVPECTPGRHCIEGNNCARDVPLKRPGPQKPHPGLTKNLNEQNNKYRTYIQQMKEEIENVNLSNAKLLYQNRVLDSNSLNERQKDRIVETILNAKTVEEAKIIYETLQSAVGASAPKPQPKSLNEVVTKRSSAFMPRKEEKREDPFMARMKALAGITDK